MHRLRGTLIMNIAPVALAAALLFALAPACSMPECGGSLGLLGPVEHACGAAAKDHSCEGETTPEPKCEGYMMVDDTPDGVPAPQPPLLAVAAIDSVDVAEVVSVDSHLPATDVPVAPDDPLGARLRV